MRTILIKSKKLLNKTPSGGQFYSAFSTIEALFDEAKSEFGDRLIIGVDFAGGNEEDLKKYFKAPYKVERQILYPLWSKTNIGFWEYVHCLTEDIYYKNLFHSRVLFHVRGIQDWVVQDLPGKRTKVQRHLFVKYLSRMAYRHLVPSSFLKDQLIKHYRFNPKRVDVIPNGYDPKLFFPEERCVAYKAIERKYPITKSKLTVLHVSDLSYKKNIEAVFLVSRELLKSRDIELLIVGGRNEAAINDARRKAKGYGLLEKTRFIGPVMQSELRHFYNIADLFLYPSRFDSFGKPALECMACGCPLLVSTRSGITDFFNDPRFVVDHNDIENMIKLSLATLDMRRNNDELRADLSRKAQEFTWDCSADRLIDYYLNL